MVLRAACLFYHKTIQRCRACVKVTQNRHININIQIIANCLSLSTDFKRLYAEINLSQSAECGLHTKMRLKTVANGLVVSTVHRCFKTSRAHLGLRFESINWISVYSSARTARLTSGEIIL